MIGNAVFRGAFRGLPVVKPSGLFQVVSRFSKPANLWTSTSFATQSARLSSISVAKSIPKTSWGQSSSKFNFNWMRSMSLVLGASISVIGLRSNSPIYNDTVVPLQQIEITPREPKVSRFNGKLNYEELTIGSVTGLFLGVIAGKLSSVLVVLTLASYFLLQFLESRKLITIPWNTIINVGKEQINVKNLVFEKPSFKLSFVLCFLIAAFNI